MDRVPHDNRFGRRSVRTREVKTAPFRPRSRMGQSVRHVGERPLVGRCVVTKSPPKDAAVRSRSSGVRVVLTRVR